MHFGARRGDTTWAHQIAALATFHSTILTIAAHPETVLQHPAAAVIKSIPPVWDETIVLPASRIGELSVFARCRGSMWMLAVMHAGEPTTLRLPLKFLGATGGDYAATYVRDDATKPDAVKIETGRAHADDVIEVQLAAGGGFVGRFVKE